MQDLSLTIRSGDEDYSVTPVDITVENLSKLYDRMSQFPVIFGRPLTGPEDFLSLFMRYSRPHRDPEMRGLFWAVNDFDVGVFYLTDIMKYEATVHFAFFDKKIKGRENLLRETAAKTLEFFNFNRLNATIPQYVKYRVHKFVRESGAICEGKKFRSAYYNGKWYDEVRYAYLNEALTKSYEEQYGSQQSRYTGNSFD
jgi:hypothetical protein